MRNIILLILLLFCQTAHLVNPIPNRSTQEISRFGIPSVQFNAREIGNGRMYVTNLDKLRDLLLVVRNASLIVGLRRMDQLLASNRAEGKLQQPIQQSVPFPCNVTHGRSSEPPRHIAKLRPGDIDIVAAFGDSVVAGNGLLSEHYLDIVSEYRGYSFSGGGIDNWRTALTLPNILKLYNPRVYGYARAHALMVDKERAVFNVAEPMLTMRDLPFQAHVLIQRLQSDPQVNMKEHWKLLTIQVGINDICFEMCIWDSTEEFLRLQRKQIERAFTLLRDNVPRLMINWILPPNLHDFRRMLYNFPFFCSLRTICSCMSLHFSTKYADALQQLQKMHWEIAASPQFRRDDFVIVPHELLRNVSGIVFTRGKLDMRFFSHDCMHYSQRSHAIMASALWNSMQQPLDYSRTQAWRQPLKHLHCPSDEQPFLRIQ